MKKGKLLPVTGICGLCVIFYAVTMLPQDRVFAEHKKAFSDISHPEGTEFVEDYYSFGALDKTRVMYKDDFPQGCDYRAAEVRRYSGTHDRIKAFYADKVVIVNGQASSIGIMFIPLDSNGLIDVYGLARDEIINWGPGVFDILQELRDDQDLGFLKFKPLARYYFLSSGGFSSSNLDFRCLF